MAQVYLLPDVLSEHSKVGVTEGLYVWEDICAPGIACYVEKMADSNIFRLFALSDFKKNSYHYKFI